MSGTRCPRFYVLLVAIFLFSCDDDGGTTDQDVATDSSQDAAEDVTEDADLIDDDVDAAVDVVDEGDEPIVDVVDEGDEPTVDAVEDEEPIVVDCTSDRLTVVSTTPADGAVDVAVDSNIEIVFARPVDPTTTGNVQLRDVYGGNTRAFSESWNDDYTVLTLDPEHPLSLGARRYQIFIPYYTGVRDIYGCILDVSLESEFDTALDPEAPHDVSLLTSFQSVHDLHVFDTGSEHLLLFEADRSGTLLSELWYIRMTEPGTVDSSIQLNTHGQRVEWLAADYSDGVLGVLWSLGGLLYERYDASTGTALNTDYVEIASFDSGVQRSGIDIVRGSSEWAITWQSDVGTEDYEVLFGRLDDDSLIGDATTQISDTTGPSHSPQVRWTGTEYGVFWLEETADMTHSLWMARVDTAGAVIESKSALLSVTEWGWNGCEPSILWTLDWTGTDYLIAWIDDDQDAMFRRFDSSGTADGDAVRVTGVSGEPQTIAFAYNDDQYAFAWVDSRLITGGAHLFFSRFDSSLSRLAPDVRISFGPNIAESPSLFWTGTEWMAFWSEWGAMGTDSNISSAVPPD